MTPHHASPQLVVPSKTNKTILYPARKLFESAMKEKPDRRRFVFLTDHPYYAENLIHDDFFTVYITQQAEENAYTINEFYEFIHDFQKTSYITEYFFLPICAKSQNNELHKALKSRNCKSSRDAWKAFAQKADFFQEHAGEMMGAAQSVVDIAKGEKRPGRPKKEKAPGIDGQTDFITIENLTQHLLDAGIELRYNVISRTPDIKGLDPKYSEEHATAILPTILHNDLKFIYDKCPKGDIVDILDVISTTNRYNPVLDMIDSVKWDGNDRLPELFNILNITDDDQLSKVLLQKWLWQSLSMARNELKNAYGADGLLVLQGPQGIGKTSFARKMAVRQEFCLIGKSLDFRDKDTLRRCGSAWIVELGEIETTFKSDKEKLKSFITDEKDLYRLPYGRADVNLPRRTSLIGTCNSTEYLIDETGNRRFWTVPIESIDLNALDKFNALQLWAQMDKLTHNDRQGFRLTNEEQAELAIRNGRHEKPLKGELEVRDIFDMAQRRKDTFAFKRVTVTEFIQTHDALKKYSAIQISQALNKIGANPPETERINGKLSKLRLLPVWKDGNY